MELLLLLMTVVLVLLLLIGKVAHFPDIWLFFCKNKWRKLRRLGGGGGGSWCCFYKASSLFLLVTSQQQILLALHHQHVIILRIIYYFLLSFAFQYSAFHSSTLRKNTWCLEYSTGIHEHSKTGNSNKFTNQETNVILISGLKTSYICKFYNN